MSKAFTRETEDDDDEEEASLPELPGGGKNYMTPQGYARLRAELLQLMDDERPKVVEAVHWAAQQRRPLRKRRLHLRQEAAARNRPAHPLSHQAAGTGGSHRPVGASRRRPGLLRRHRDLCRGVRPGAHHHHPGHRRGRQRAWPGELDLADRASPAQGARGRRRQAGHAAAACRKSRCWKCSYPAPRPEQTKRLPGRTRCTRITDDVRLRARITDFEVGEVAHRDRRSAGRWRPAAFSSPMSTCVMSASAPASAAATRASTPLPLRHRHQQRRSRMAAPARRPTRR